MQWVTWVLVFAGERFGYPASKPEIVVRAKLEAGLLAFRLARQSEEVRLVQKLRAANVHHFDKEAGVIKTRMNQAIAQRRNAHGQIETWAQHMHSFGRGCTLPLPQLPSPVTVIDHQLRCS